MAKLVIFYSRADENYYSGSYRYITEGNTEKLAKMIAKAAGAVALLEHLIAKAMQKAMDIVEKAMPFPVKTYRKADAQDKAGQSQQNGAPAVKKTVIELMQLKESIWIIRRLAQSMKKPMEKKWRMP